MGVRQSEWAAGIETINFKDTEMIISPNPVIELKRENGKRVTIGNHGCDVTIVVWRKNDSVLLPLVISRMEAHRLKTALEEAICKANGEAT